MVLGKAAGQAYFISTEGLIHCGLIPLALGCFDVRSRTSAGHRSRSRARLGRAGNARSGCICGYQPICSVEVGILLRDDQIICGGSSVAAARD